MTFVTVLKSGGIYTPDWVTKLNRQAVEHLRPDRVVCLTDMQVTDCETAPLHEGWAVGWFAKICTFRPGLFDGPCLYIDLDTLILKPITALPWLWHGRTSPSLALLDDFYSPRLPATGVMAWQPGAETDKIYHDFARAPQIKPGWRNGDGSIIGNYPHMRLQALFPGAFGSFKKDKLMAGPCDLSVVCFHGAPKCGDFASDHWITRHWLGTSPAP